jgi:hypothetical protein
MKWEVWMPGGSIQNNKLNFSSELSINDAYQINSTFYFTSRFDVRVDFDIPVFVGIDGEHFTDLKMRAIHHDTGAEGNIEIRDIGAGGRFYCYAGPYEDGWVATTNTSGKFRIVRDTDDTIRVFYWNSSLSRWEFNGNLDGKGVGSVSGNLNIILELHSGSILDGNFDNFEVYSGCEDTEGPSASISESPSSSLSGSFSSSPSATLSGSPSASLSNSPSSSPSATGSPSATPSASISGSKSFSPSESLSGSKSSSLSGSASATPSAGVIQVWVWERTA